MEVFEKYFIEDTAKLNWDYVDTIPEFIRLKECQQNPKWHGEGTAYQHTRLCIKAAYRRLKCLDTMSLEWARTILMAVLFHDIGKATTTIFKNDNWHSYGHETEGEKIARRILWEEEFEARERVCTSIRYHMDVLKIAESKDSFQKMIQMSWQPFFRWYDVLFVKYCDVEGSQPDNPEQTSIDMRKLGFVQESIISLGIVNDKNNNYLFAKAFNRRCDFVKDEDENKTVINVLIGLPGAGKNTFIEKHWKDKDYVAISRDDIRVELGYCKEGDKIIGTNEQEEQVSKVFNERLVSAAVEGKEVIINNINLKKKYRDDYKNLVTLPNAKWVYWYVEAPTLMDNVNRRPMISKMSFLNMIDKFDWPRCEECDNFYYSLNDEENN